MRRIVFGVAGCLLFLALAQSAIVINTSPSFPEGLYLRRHIGHHGKATWCLSAHPGKKFFVQSGSGAGLLQGFVNPGRK